MKKRRFLFMTMTIFVPALFIISVFFITRLQEISVKGNTYYSEKEMKELLYEKIPYHNTFLAYANFKWGKKLKVPFISGIDVNMIGLNKLDVRVFEKDICGALPYMGEYICFDKDGIMVGSIKEKREDVPIILGITYKKAIYNEMMETDSPEVFENIFHLTRLIKEYKVPIELIKVNLDLSVSMMSDQIRIDLGKRNHYDEQISNLPFMLASLKGKRGALKMEDYSGRKGNAIFKEE